MTSIALATVALVALAATPAGDPVVYTAASLYDRIDGGAELVKELGFVDLTVQRFGVGDAQPGGGGPPRQTLEVEQYRMRDALGALALYLDRCGDETPDPGLAARHTVGRYQLLMLCGDTVSVVTNPTGDETLVPVMVLLATDRCDGTPAAPPDPFAALPTEGLNPASRRIIRGPVSLAAHVTLGGGDILQLGDTHIGVAGLYATQDGTMTRVVVDYGDPVEAASALRHLSTNLDSYLERHNSDESSLTWKDWAGRFGDARVTGTLLTIRVGLAAPPG